MYNPQSAAPAGSPPGHSPDKHHSEASERIGNEQIRELLRVYGLRTSLIRLKIIDALHDAHLEGRAIGVRGMHAQLTRLDSPLSFLSVREVLKRLCAEGVIVLGSDKCYTLAPQARRILGQSCPRSTG